MLWIRSIFATSINQSSSGMKSYNKKFVYSICLVSAMGGLLFGYDWVVIGGAKPFYELYFGIADSPTMQGLAMSVALLGCLIGAMVAGMMADRYGRKPLLLISAFIFLSSAYATGAFSVFSWFLAARFLGGIGIGIASGLSPMYIAEVAPTSIRGKLVSLNQLTIVLGILGAQIANWLIAEPIPADFTPADICASWNGQMGWRWMFWGAAFPAAVFLLLACFIPESPRWLAMKGKREKAWSVLSRIGGNRYAEQELQMVEQTSASKSEGGLKLLFSRPFRKVLVLGVIVAVFQQWCGTNVIFNYAQEIFQSAGYSLGDVLFNIVVTGVANVIFTFVAIYTVERLGRRALMLLGAGGLAGIYLILGTCYFFEVSGFFMVVLVVLGDRLLCHVTWGRSSWVLLAEIFPEPSTWCGYGNLYLLLCGSASFTLTYTFPLLNNVLGSYGTFWIYTAYLRCRLPVLPAVHCPKQKGNRWKTLEKDLIK